MADFDFVVGQDDKLPILLLTLLNPDGTVVNLTGVLVSDTQFVMRHTLGLAVISGVLEIVAPATGGQVIYHWGTGDTAVPGDYVGQVHVQRVGGQETFPNDSYYRIRVTPAMKS